MLTPCRAIASGPYEWQATDLSDGPGGPFYQFCDYVENANGHGATVPGAAGVGLEKALAGYAAWFYNLSLPGACEAYGYADFNGTYNVECYNTHNATSPLFTDLTVENPEDRQWFWMLCNQPFGYWQDGAPTNVSTIISRKINVHYNTRQCGLYFPEVNGYTYGIAEAKTEAQQNKYTGGWDITNVDRLFYINGGRDPWRDATVSSDFRPGGRFEGNENTIVRIIPDGYHGSDVAVSNGLVNAGAAAVQADMVEYLQTWVKAFVPS